jgi:DNA repair protein RadC
MKSLAPHDRPREKLDRLGAGVLGDNELIAVILGHGFAVELGRRTLARTPGERALLASPRDVASYLMPSHGAAPVEQFGVLMLDTKHRVIRTSVLSVGTLDASLVHPREVFRAAADCRAAAVVLFHNHPSGDPSPSADDLALTRRLVDAGVLMGIEVLDHLVLADAKYYSFKEAGRI